MAGSSPCGRRRSGGIPGSDVDTVSTWGVFFWPYEPSWVTPLWWKSATAAAVDACVLFWLIPVLSAIVSAITSALAMVWLLPSSPILAMLLLLLSGHPALAMLLLLLLLPDSPDSPLSYSTSPDSTPAARVMSGGWESPVWTRPTAGSRERPKHEPRYLLPSSCALARGTSLVPGPRAWSWSECDHGATYSCRFHSPTKGLAACVS